ASTFSSNWHNPPPDAFMSATTNQWDIDTSTGGWSIPPKLRMDDFKDGASNTILVGEKALYTDQVVNAWDYGDDQPIFSGGVWGTARGGTRVVRDSPSSSGNRSQDLGSSRSSANWGSPFSAGANFAFGDGSVRLIPFGDSLEFRFR